MNVLQYNATLLTSFTYKPWKVGARHPHWKRCFHRGSSAPEQTWYTRCKGYDTHCSIRHLRRLIHQGRAAIPSIANKGEAAPAPLQNVRTIILCSHLRIQHPVFLCNHRVMYPEIQRPISLCCHFRIQRTVSFFVPT